MLPQTIFPPPHLLCEVLGTTLEFTVQNIFKCPPPCQDISPTLNSAAGIRVLFFTTTHRGCLFPFLELQHIKTGTGWQVKDCSFRAINLFVKPNSSKISWKNQHGRWSDYWLQVYMTWNLHWHKKSLRPFLLVPLLLVGTTGFTPLGDSTSSSNANGARLK